MTSTSARPERDAPWVAIDASSTLVPSGGIGRYTHAVAQAVTSEPVAPPARLVYPALLPGKPTPPFAKEWLHPLPLDSRRFRLMLWASARLGMRPDRLYGEPALVHAPAGEGPLFRHARLVITIHDLSFLSHPEWHRGRTAWLLGQTVPHAARHADLVLTDSEHVRTHVISWLRVPAERVRTAPLFAADAFRPLPLDRARGLVAERFGLREPFVLQVGTIEPRKNHVRVIEAFEEMRRAGFPGRLVLAGRNGWRVGPIHARIERSSEAHAVLHIPEVTDEDLAALYSACTVFVFPSLDEGFGLPLLEAMSCGAPCVTSRGSSLTEVAGDGAVLVDPADARALAEPMIDLWRNESQRDDAMARAQRRASEFSRERWTRGLLDTYRSMLAMGAR
jgi:glycosyltransferase involved in cell wall biosynthesis